MAPAPTAWRRLTGWTLAGTGLFFIIILVGLGHWSRDAFPPILVRGMMRYFGFAALGGLLILVLDRVWPKVPSWIKPSRHHYATAGLVLATLLTLTVAGEFLFRHLDGFHPLEWRLRTDLDRSREKLSKGPSLHRLARATTFREDVEAEWLLQPRPLPLRHEVPPELTRRARVHPAAEVNHLWNDLYMKKAPGLVRSLARGLTPLTFPAYDETFFPHFRLPPGVTLPTGLTTNRFGFRGPEIDLNKPPGTIRIACVGASTTISAHVFPFSYPELIQIWLNLWAKKKGHPVSFEVINAGRSGFKSSDIASVVRYELLPMEPDYVIYYEGANQFTLRTVVSWPPSAKFAAPPPDVAPSHLGRPAKDASLLERATVYSALARRVFALRERWRGGFAEPAKPKARWIGPEEFSGDAEPPVLLLPKILADLRRIKADLGSQDGRLVLSTFKWFVQPGMVLDRIRHRGILVFLNRNLWPVHYADVRRAADLQNRAFAAWARQEGVPLLDVAGKMPDEADLFADPIHNTYPGLCIRAWVTFQELLPILAKDLAETRVPRPDRERLERHPHLQ